MRRGGHLERLGRSSKPGVRPPPSTAPPTRVRSKRSTPRLGSPSGRRDYRARPIGSCSEDGQGVVACSVYTGDTPEDMGYYLLNASNGQVIEHISTPGAFLFAQPVFDNNDLIVAGRNGIGVTAYEITTPGAPITSVSPSTITAGVTSTITLTGSGFQSGAKVFVSGTLVGGQHGTSP